MARREVIQLDDDLDGGPADETVTFSIGSTSYEMDLSTKNADKFRKALAPWVEIARKSSGSRRAGRRATASSRPDPKSVRAWAQANGITVSDRGRVPSEIVELFKQAGT